MYHYILYLLKHRKKFGQTRHSIQIFFKYMDNVVYLIFIVKCGGPFCTNTMYSLLSQGRIDNDVALYILQLLIILRIKILIK